VLERGVLPMVFVAAANCAPSANRVTSLGVGIEARKPDGRFPITLDLPQYPCYIHIPHSDPWQRHGLRPGVRDPLATSG